MKYVAYYGLMRLFTSPSTQDESISVLAWLIVAAIETAIISLVVAGIARAANKKNDFSEWFYGSFVVVGIIQVILGVISLFM